MSLSLQRKVSLSALLILLIAISVIALLLYAGSNDKIIENEVKALNQQAGHQVAYLQQEINHIKQDINLLKSSPALSSFVNIPITENPIQQQYNRSKGKLVNDFSRLLLARHAYKTISLIGIENNGREILRISKDNLSGNIINHEDLKEKGDYPYFYEALKLESDHYYITLEKENQAGQEEYILTSQNIIISSPILLSGRDTIGVISVTIDFNQQINHLASHIDRYTHFAIEFPNGIYASHIYNGKQHEIRGNNISKNVEDNYITGVYFPEIFLHHDKGMDIVRSEDFIVAHNHFELIPGKEIRLILGKEVNQIKNENIQYLVGTKYLTILVIMLSLLFAVVLTGLPLKNLKVLTEIVKGIARGERVREDLPVDLRNEVGDLSRSFNYLLNKIENKEKELESAKERLELAINAASDGVWDWDIVNDTCNVSRRYLDILGYNEGEIETDSRSLRKLVHPDDTNRLKKFTKSYLSGEIEKYEIEIRMKHKNGYYVDVLTIGRAVRDKNGKAIRLIGINRDITERKRELNKLITQEKLQRQILVKEVHHRIKNNLQGVASLLRQNSEKYQNYKDEFDTAITQVYTIAMVYGIQARSRKGGLYIEEMLREIVRISEDVTGSAINVKGINSHCKYRVHEKEAVPVALMLNELITNACKHTTGGEKISVEIVCDWCNNQSVAMTIVNSVDSFPEEFSLEEKKGLGTGLNLVLSLLPPTGATLSINEDKGFCYTKLVLSEPVIIVESDWEYLAIKQA